MNDAGVAIDYTPLGTNMEFEDLTLPRDKFNRFRYFFIVRPHFTFVLVLAVVIVTICLVCFIIRRAYDGLELFILIVFPLTPGFLLLTALADTPQDVTLTGNTRSSISFLGEVVKFRPGLDENKWDLIAARTNRTFHHNDNKITPYLFYDGAQCHSYFKRHYVDPARGKDINGSETAKVGIQPMIDRALKVYTDSLEEYWGECMAEINDISGQNNVGNDSDKDQTVS